MHVHLAKKRGVPEKQLEKDICRDSNYTITNCTHDVDTTLHEDTVTVEYYIQYEYIRRESINTYLYQYNRASDIWTKVSCIDSDCNYVAMDHLLNTEWSGTSRRVFKDVYYTITVDAINTNDGMLTFSYDIYYSGTSYTGTACIEYDSWSVEVENMFTVSLVPDEGIKLYA